MTDSTTPQDAKAMPPASAGSVALVALALAGWLCAGYWYIAWWAANDTITLLRANGTRMERQAGNE